MNIYFKNIQVGGGDVPPGYLRLPISDSDIAILSNSEIDSIKLSINNFINKYNTRPMLFKLIKE